MGLKRTALTSFDLAISFAVAEPASAQDRLSREPSEPSLVLILRGGLSEGFVRSSMAIVLGI